MTIVPAIPNGAPDIQWAFHKYLLSRLIDAHFANGDTDLEIINDRATDSNVIK